MGQVVNGGADSNTETLTRVYIAQMQKTEDVRALATSKLTEIILNCLWMQINSMTSQARAIIDCDEAALYLNKSAGQKVIVPTRTKHTHSLSVATNEHISVHCCVNAAGHAIPPVIAFSKSLQGGAYLRNKPINTSYACSDSGF
jgi:hypothetical protein